MPFLDTNKLPQDERRPGWLGRYFHSPTLTFAHWEFAKGADIHAHSHEQEEVWQVLEGELQVTIGAETQIAGPGMVAVVPPHTAHSVVALSDGKAIVTDFPLRPGMAGPRL
ncbi:MAG TPA: cupin domain-containing protein [Phenylobacterium sp.]|jgi:quercetin dioxygenase-like cupin family protein|uniref:cupin domain-containing protein n=1 Tax=Phenylobacterium sp. TaxID=1871053 RepID=UPI002D3C901A|nr:cupin domain-containing protein [Phenylobacterium sp.]HZZ69904.1 cupin domain-containing protein [Phenylobacterium sp.]